MEKTDTPGEVLSTERKINWLASYPKSGNTWVRMFLNAYVTKRPIEINSAYQYVATDLKPEIYQMMMPRPISELDLAQQFMYHQGALLNLIKMASTKDVCVKTHNAKAVVDGIHLIPARISGPSVYIIRDPRDVVLSHAEHFSQTVVEAIKSLNDSTRVGQTEFNLCHMFMDWSTHVKSWTIENKDVDVLVLKYEDLFNDKAFEEILKQFGLDFEQERFDFALRESSFKNLQSKEETNGFNERKGGDRFFRIGKIGQWKSKLTSYEADKIKDCHKEMMEIYGYC